MHETAHETLAPPRFVDGRAMQIAGYTQRYNCDTTSQIPEQWQRFTPHLGHIDGQIGNVAYGVLINTQDPANVDYTTGVEVSASARLPTGFARVEIPAQRYAVFHHDGHISTLRDTWNAIWKTWFPQSGRQPSGGPSFERYDEHFDPATGNGGFELWIPVRG